MGEICEYDEKLVEDRLKYSTTCTVANKKFTIMTFDKRLAKDVAEWVSQGKLLVTDFTNIENEKDTEDQLIVEIRKKC
jgi:SepF-like predicted cell division protein (DUF552 family)